MRRAAWLSISALASGCYLGADTVPTGTVAMDGSVIDLDGGRPSGDMRNDSGNPSIMMDASGPPPGCLTSASCPSSAPVCNAGVCQICKQAQDCARFASTPACAGNGACVTCAGEQKSLCTGDAGACDPVTNACVQCVVETDCPSSNAPVCKADRSCGGCASNDDCTRFSATPVCDTTTKTCVACLPSSEKVDCRSDKTCDPSMTDCAGTACDPKKLTCTQTARGTLTTCRSCVSDSECVTSNRCIPLHYGAGSSAMELGGFCLQTLSDAGCTAPRTTALTRDSTSGITGGTYCGFDETLTSCKAIDALFAATQCSGSDATACNAPGALCRTVSTVLNSCTYACTTSRDCFGNSPCGQPGSDGVRWCGGPQ